MARFFIIASLCFAAVSAFAPTTMKMTKNKSLTATRRDALYKGAAFLGATTFLVASPKPTFAGSLEVNNPIPDNEYVPSQQAKSDKIDINSAFVGDYKRLRGFFPHAAGMIASNGPYDSVADLYKIPGITENDKKLFKQYENEFIALPAMYRQFNERINARVST